MSNNPFSISFGKSPEEMIQRYSQQTEIFDDFTSDIPSSHSYIITGVRGSGKTVLLNEAESMFETLPDWVVINLNPESDLLREFLAKLSGTEIVNSIRDIKLHIGAFGFELEVGNKSIVDYETAI
ncbi:MAG: ATP-binding protein, partial [Clostridia bacterium]|nr:ATP-binding protein [Clostridia bacterium]